MKRIILFCVATLLVLVFSGTVYGQDLCDNYLDKYRVCVEDKNASGNLDFSECKGYTNLGSCEANGCYWSDDNDRCGIYICECDANIDGKVTGADLGVYKEEYGRFDCPITPDVPTVPCQWLSCIPCEGTLSPLGRWCDQGDGTVKDMTTCLVWLQDANCMVRMNWYIAIEQPITSLKNGDCGGTLADGSVWGDWRLPTLNELEGITVGEEYITPMQTYKFTGVQSRYGYWSSTTDASNTYEAWLVYMGTGLVVSGNKTASYDYVWPVRGDFY